MQTTLDSVLTKKYLIATVIGIIAINLITNTISKDLAILTGNLSYIPLAGLFLVLSILLAFRFGLGGTHGLAWVSFAGYAISWFIAEMLWINEELVLHEDPYPSIADIFYVMGYPFLLMFFIAYLQPVRAAITKKAIAISCTISIGVLMPSLYFALGNPSDQGTLATVLGAVYPAFDSLVIIPALIGVVLFFKGQVNLMWTLVCIGIICLFAADTIFLIGQLDDSYYTGSPVEMLFHLNYVFLSFGVYSNLVLFKKEKNSHQMNTP
ncbi:MAG: hypothetical protein EB150_02460 [Nitrososphaeria archaeon]|nr:hypothetical protein [Nitrososphaeria archaeon]NDB50824.1 hypothetical protein [Nitrosopumilaceae archaeon]NDB88502.1 hypothetical protein [Nitrososphaerota archaeon]NDB45992.1 hypothetical protein [Nitrososphaeria archaeon]NDB89556.1 hypothetical protein [Nitrososphaerota archaeon]